MTVALFPGRFQPPHIGHILTLMRLHPLYDKIVIMVSPYTFEGRKPQIIEPSEAVEVLKEIFKYLPKYQVIHVDRGFIERARYDDLPHFDVVVHGDPVAIQHAERLGIEYVYVPPSTIGGMEINATLIRKALSAANRR